ncbi:MAG TPA: mechanosensitive ion channel domain-containing protein [Longimicrobiales bacterium]
MENVLSFLQELPIPARIVAILVIALVAHVLTRVVHRIGDRIMAPHGGGPYGLARGRPKVASVTTLIVSALTFTIYFAGLGLILVQLGVPVAGYIASATVVGLAIGFGAQGLVQDVVSGLTLIFSDVLDVGDVADIGGQTGRVEAIGLRFTTLVTVLDQRVFVPNRSIAQINRYRKGYIRAYADAQVPAGVTDEQALAVIEPLARGMFRQFQGIVLTEPEILGVRAAEPGGWRFVRVKFRLWPGQGALIEDTFRQRVIHALRELDPGYADWMVTVTYRTAEESESRPLTGAMRPGEE